MNYLSQWMTALTETYARVLSASAEFVPNVLAAALLLFLGWIAGKLLRNIIRKIGERIDAALANARSRLHPALQKIRWPISQILGEVVFWIVFLFFVSVAAETLGFPGVIEWFGQLVEFLPAVIATIIIILSGYWFSGVIGRLAVSASTTAGYKNPELFGRLASGMILMITVVLGLDQLQFDIGLLVNLITITVAALFGGFALAFGMGASRTVSNIMAGRAITNIYSVGQRVRVDELEGVIVEITSTSVIIETKQGRANIPAVLFDEKYSIALEHSITPDGGNADA